LSTVVTCPPDRRRELVATLAEAFVTDPVVTWLLGEARADERRRRRFFRLLVSRATVGLGGCDLTDGGAAVWYPPGGYEATAQSSLRDAPAALATFGRRLGIAGRADAAMRANHPAEPHWYLQFVGVEPERRGHGTGTALLEHRLARIDAEHQAAYLESSHERNLPLYERFGFVVRDEVRLGPGAPPEWLMWRAPVGPVG
jgi:GNAT superfamily N-acetyltransferase